MYNMEKGYGVITSKCEYKPNAVLLLREKALENDDILHAFYVYCENYGFQTNEDDAWVSFVENYDDEVIEGTLITGSGFEGLIARVIDDAEFDGDEYFVCEDCCMYVPADIPFDEEEKQKMPTQKDIRTLLAKYMNPLLKSPVVVEWLDINRG